MGCPPVRTLASGLLLTLAATPPSPAQGERPGLRSLLLQPGWECTTLPRGLWLPLAVLHERLELDGYEVVSADETADNCYSFRLRRPNLPERNVVFNPVSGKPLP